MNKGEYTQYEGLIKSIAISFNATTGMEVDDLVSEGKVVFMKLTEKYDESKGSFSNFLTHAVRRHYISLIPKEKRTKLNVGFEEDEIFDQYLTTRCTELEVEFRDAIRSLSVEAKSVVLLILQSPTELLESVVSVKKASVFRRILRGYIQRNWKWKRSQVFKVFREIKESL
jgi:RNA polymerase sigma factor (sigma-70 family)